MKATFKAPFITTLLRLTHIASIKYPYAVVLTVYMYGQLIKQTHA